MRRQEGGNRAGKLKFLFIQPDWHRHYVPFFPVYEPLHGLLLGAVVSDLAETRIFDRRFDTDKNLARELRDFAPDIVGITTHTAGEIFTSLRILRDVKRLRPEALTIVGGQHATLLPEDLFDTSVDMVCIGPGEETFREVVETLAAGEDLDQVAGLALKQGSEYLITPPRMLKSGMLSWPKMDRSLLPKRYTRHYWQCFERRTTVYTITTSGCPYRCKFCALWAAARGTYRQRPADEIVEEIASQSQPYVHLTDDNTFHDEDHAMEIYRLLKKRGVKKKILAYARTDTIVDKAHLIEKWCEVGLGALVVGMEAVSDKHLDTLNKKASVEVNIDAQRVMDRLDIENWAHFVAMPEFQKEDFDATWDFIERLNLTYPIIAAMTPVPGTPYFWESKEKGDISTFDYGFYNLQYMVSRTRIPKEEWYRHFWGLYRKSCSPRTLWRRYRGSPSFHLRPAVGRAMVSSKTVRLIQSHIREQLEHEKTFCYEAAEPTLPPSLRRDYRPDKYYNAATLGELKKCAAPAPASAPASAQANQSERSQTHANV
jgi:hopanoid C-3 methylase